MKRILANDINTGSDLDCGGYRTTFVEQVLGRDCDVETEQQAIEEFARKDSELFASAVNQIPEVKKKAHHSKK